MIFWISITFLCILIQGCYGMIEMAALSFNRIRLQYYVSKGHKRAIWLQYLLQKPYRLFGSIMLGVNIALQVGSQSARELYTSMHLDPDLAPITQVFLVVIFAELTPLFAARRCSEHVIMLGTPIVYFTYRIFSPLIWVISLVVRLIYHFVGKDKKSFELDLSREELQKILETQEQESDDFNLVVANIFSLRNQRADDAMTKIDQIELLPTTCNIATFRQKMAVHKQPYYPIYHKSPANIVGIAFPKELVQLPDEALVRDFAHSPWFIIQGSKLTAILQQFRRNKQTVSVVLGPKGSAVGLLTLKTILKVIFCEMKTTPKKVPKITVPLIERTFPGNKTIADFNEEYGTRLPTKGAVTLAQLMTTHLNHPPHNGDSIVIDQLEFTAEETTLLGVKSVNIKNLTT